MTTLGSGSGGLSGGCHRDFFCAPYGVGGQQGPPVKVPIAC